MKIVGEQSAGFLRALQFPPTGKVDGVGYDKHN